MGENLVATLALLFLIESSSFLQVTRITITSRMSVNFRQIPSWTAELAALERLEKCCGHSNAFILDWIFFILAGNKDMHISLNEFKFLPDPTTDFGVICP